MLFLSKERYKFLGYMLMPGLLASAPKHVDAIKTAALQKGNPQIKTFPGPGSVRRSFDRGFSEIAQPFNDYLRKDKEFYWLDLTAKAPDVFEAIDPRKKPSCDGFSTAKKSHTCSKPMHLHMRWVLSSFNSKRQQFERVR